MSFRLGLNPAELADFLSGWLGWDLLMDDHRGPLPQEFEEHRGKR